MSNEALTWAFKQQGIPSGAKFVLVVLADHADEAWTCFPGQRKIARMTSMGERSVRRWLDWLEEEGYITRHQRRGEEGRRSTDRYCILQERPSTTGETGRSTTGQSGRSSTEAQFTATGQSGQRPNVPVGQPANLASGQSGRSAEPPVEASGQSGQRPVLQSQPANLAGQEPSVEPSLSVSEREGAAKKGPIPTGFALTEEMRTWAADRAPGIDPDFQTEQFIDYWLAKGEHRADWVATWRQWMRNQERWRRERRPAPQAAAGHAPFRNSGNSKYDNPDPWA